jgi:hypothetical protein
VTLNFAKVKFEYTGQEGRQQGRLAAVSSGDLKIAKKF